ncbi:MAG: MipA/OmpV family protein [Siculibacillus sp.]|nr:MipA/OmpV family protein [Siculibacillus sp.]
MSRRLTLALLVLAAGLGAARAGDDMVVTLGGGLKTEPGWEGSKSHVLSPFPIIGLRFLRSPLTGEATSDTGFGIAPSFRLLSSRSFGAASAMAGLPKVATAFEAGVTIDYTDRNWRAFVTARQGFGGHHGQIFELGLDGIFHPMAKLTLEAGPRVSFATTDYMRTYYGVSAASALATGIPAHAPNGGYRGAGLAARATWEIDRNWLVRGDASWTRLSDEIARSPIMRAEGRRDQFAVGLGVAYRFGVNWR